MSIQRMIRLGLGVLLVLACLIVDSDGNSSSLVVSESTKPAPPLISSAASSTVQIPARSSAASELSPAPLSATQKRRAVFDSPNVLDAVRRAQANGSPDEKGWAAQLLMECYAYIQKEQQLYQSTEAPAVEAKRMAAFDALQKRCQRVQELDWAARRAALLQFRADRPEDHAAPLWLRAGEWAMAADAVARIDSWRRIPVPLAWMAEARCLSSGDDGGVQSNWGLLAKLAWLVPARFDAVIKRLADPVLDALRKKFDAYSEPHEESASSDVADHDLIAKRKLLRDVHALLYGVYMKRR